MQRYALIMITLITILFPHTVRACGVLVSESGTNVRANHMLAAVFWDQGKQIEDLTVKVQYLVNEGEPYSFGWIMPFPSPPDIREQNHTFFDHLYYFTQKKENWLEKAELPKLSFNMGEKSEAGMPQGVEVVDQSVIGIYQTATVKATDVKALHKWAKQHDYAIPWGEHPYVQHYVDKGWYFVLMNLNETNKLEEGDIHPIRFTFRSEQPVYPILLSSLNRKGEVGSEKTVPLTLYLLSRQKMVPAAPYEEKLNLQYSGELNEVETRTLFNKEGGKLWVSRWDAVLVASQIKDEIWFEASSYLPEVGSGKMNSGDVFVLFWTLVTGGIQFISILVRLLFTLTFESVWVVNAVFAGLTLFLLIRMLMKYSWLNIFRGLIIMEGLGALLLAFYYKHEPLLALSQLAIIFFLFLWFAYRWFRKVDA
ncbi:DUF2330 domain-containing protein [Ammoniphilus sp. CFH 90114]|uniref:DUF2330 domain-containing protein n=1 Tax=Ammoniphilus sp. CFH 90114 TaxID=2493665 RepID=UPI00100EEE2C|nr:DUF2330 domain-containing protein [Ammoniphilus sp. CFH 90114]RXT15310.1 DUF2330 domain-containing protein [Ammoniphilus sp. CFH 90114]